MRHFLQREALKPPPKGGAAAAGGKRETAEACPTQACIKGITLDMMVREIDSCMANAGEKMLL